MEAAAGSATAGARMHVRRCVVAMCLLAMFGAWANSRAETAPPPPKTVFVAVAKDVKLEVLDWGGSGRALVFLAGFGATGHEFDGFAPSFIDHHHVYAITRRGFGASSKPSPTMENYSASRLGDDVLAVIGALRLDRPVLAGHSIAGEELSYIGSHHADKVSGLVYLDAGYSFAFYDPALGSEVIDNHDLRTKLDLLQGAGPGDAKLLIRELLQTDIPRYERHLREWQAELQDTPASLRLSPAPVTPQFLLMKAALDGEEKFSNIKPPVLAIFAIPKDDERKATPSVRTSVHDEYAEARAFQKGVPQARVVILPYASHVVFRSNTAEVIREMNAFMARLPQASGPAKGK
ncbi:MAG: alpha/beta hydrolase [Alphaproteobacteria bacterium]|nr:alpha/beta hydrolase [Alphaproteobacteria bacterium]